MNSVDDLSLINVPGFQDSLGILVAMEEQKEIPILLKRVFVVSGSAGSVRGKHAHRELTQVMACIHGSCTVICDDGLKRREFVLNRIDQLLCVPPGIWAEQNYSDEGTVLMVLCDLEYDEGDYIRDYDVFLEYRRETSQ